MDNTKPGQLIFFVFKENNWKEYTFEKVTENDHVSGLQKVLAMERAELKDIDGITVKVGAGSFTTTRLAVTFVNTLAFALQVPVVAVKEFKFEKLASAIKAAPVGQYAHALYTHEPRLGKK